MSKKLLVVEDSLTIARVIKHIGLSLNFEVTVASSLAEVETILQGNTDFFAATIDYSLPDALDGEAIPYILSHGIPSVVLTGKMDEKTRSKILEQPVIDYIPKENSQAFIYLKRILHWQLTNSSNGVLVVDDSSAARTYILQLLKRRNFLVYMAKNGVEALELLKQHSEIKLVVTDLEMPIMNGIELTNEIRKKYSREQLSIIGISGADNGVHSARFIKNGADDFLRKPFCIEEFYCRITQNIENLKNIDEIQKAANTDYLTQLPNRRAFFTEADEKIKQYNRDNTPFCLAMLDIDHFKKINDSYGHDAGDHTLKLISLYLRKYLSGGFLARLGGEEFAVVISGKDTNHLYSRLEEFRKKISTTRVSYQEFTFTFSVSIGVLFNDTSLLAQQLNAADAALYKAKENGRDQIVVAA